MEFMKGIRKKETVEPADLFSGAYTGKTVNLSGAVHTIRDMGEVSFLILRKAEGLIQCVWERPIFVDAAEGSGIKGEQEGGGR